jgi:hypothetical protein
MRLLFTIIFSVLLLNVFSQTIEGYIKDEHSNEPVPYFYVFVKNKFEGTVTNNEGYFKLSSKALGKNDTIVLSHISYKPVFLPFNDAALARPLVLRVSQRITVLESIEIVNEDPNHLFKDIVETTKRDHIYPSTTSIYYREFVRDNAEFNKYADALLTVALPEDEDDLNIGVEQCRVIELPKEEDDIVQAASPISVEKIIGYQYLNVLDRFTGENEANYNFEFHRDEQTDDYRLTIRPKEEVPRQKNNPLYYAFIVADAGRKIAQVNIAMDSTTVLEKSILGVTVKIKNFDITLYFKTIDGKKYLSFGRVITNIEFNSKRFTQTNEYLSEFMTTGIKSGAVAIDKKTKLRDKTLYRHGSHYTYSFWDDINIPPHSEKEKSIISKLNEKPDVKE